MSDQTYCARHRETATNLRCSRCDTLVCPRCMVHSAVGIRCPECGKAPRIPMYDVSAALMVRAILASLLLGVGGGLAFALVVRPILLFQSPLIYVAAMAGYGFLVAEGASLAAKRKRGRALQYVAAGGMAVALVLVTANAIATGDLIGLFDLLAGGAGLYIAILRMR